MAGGAACAAGVTLITTPLGPGQVGGSGARMGVCRLLVGASVPLLAFRAGEAPFGSGGTEGHKPHTSGCFVTEHLSLGAVGMLLRSSRKLPSSDFPRKGAERFLLKTVVVGRRGSARPLVAQCSRQWPVWIGAPQVWCPDSRVLPRLQTRRLCGEAASSTRRTLMVARLRFEPARVNCVTRSLLGSSQQLSAAAPLLHPLRR